jgi:multidrug efflux pump subunit AcrA (membrane-fusion protein)
MDAEVSGELALRKPQLAQAEADVKSAEVNLGEAKLNLSRTTIRAPFDSIVLEESVDIGQRVGPTTSIATLAGTAVFWVSASVPLDSFGRIVPEDNGDGSPVSIYLDTGLGGTVLRCGKVVRKLGNLDPEGRMGKVLISIEDPLSLKNGAREKAVPLDSYVRAEISTGAINNVYRIPRRGLRENNTVWVADKDGKLRIRPVTIAWRYLDDVYVRADFGEGDRLIDTYLSSVIPGMDVKIRDSEEEMEPAGEKLASAGIEPFCGKE